MERQGSQGRHGGNHGPADKGDDKNPTKRDSRNTDVDSLRKDRNENRAGGRHPGGG